MQYKEERNSAQLKVRPAEMPREPAHSTDALFDMVEAGIRDLAEKLGGPLSELQESVASLSTLVGTLSLRAEFIARLIDKSTPTRLRDSMQSYMKAMHMEQNLVGQEMLTVSNGLIRKAAVLIAAAQQRINKEAHEAAGYSLKPCARCKGAGRLNQSPCVACKGRGNILTREPSAS